MLNADPTVEIFDVENAQPAVRAYWAVGMATADFDGDGDIDITTNHNFAGEAGSADRQTLCRESRSPGHAPYLPPPVHHMADS